ncbi:hypothetical protein SAMN05444920_15614 [Nonomuraea solani]|uniref:Uncharacterized protein n=2 Tax=Nonomuraea solani TaxID=1144553 RepID=A0A1H6F1S9_9ACTN|nr:hypothetical protein SAMN05444920_15614 [Nonomuraea solani]
MSRERPNLHPAQRTGRWERLKIKLERYAPFVLAWARLRHRLGKRENQAAYQEFLATRRVDADRTSEAIATWLATGPWRDATAAYSTLEQTLQMMGSGRDLTPPTQDRRWRHSIVAGLPLCAKLK